MRSLELAVKYLAGERLIGTAAERAAMTTSVSAIPQTSWKEIDRVTLGSSGDSMDTGTFAAKDNLMILTHYPTSSEMGMKTFLQFLLIYCRNSSSNKEIFVKLTPSKNPFVDE